MKSDRLVSILYAPAVGNVGGVYCDAIEDIESIWEGIQFSWEVDVKGRLKPYGERRRRLSEIQESIELPLLSNGIEEWPATASLQEVREELGPGGQRCHIVRVTVPEADVYLSTVSQVLAEVGDTFSAWCGRTVPSEAALVLARQVTDEVPPYGWPRLKGPLSYLSRPEIPSSMGWINYWSPETCRLLGFPDDSKDAKLLTLARRTPRGSWIVQLTDEPLDLSRRDHWEMVRWAYERFDRLGARV